MFFEKIHVIKQNSKKTFLRNFDKSIFKKVNQKIFDSYGLGGGNNRNGGGNKKYTFDSNNGNFLPWILMLCFLEEDEEDYMEDYDDSKIEEESNIKSNEETIFSSSSGSDFYVVDIHSTSLPSGQDVPTLDDLKSKMNTHIGFLGNLDELQRDIENIKNEATLLFESIDYDLIHVKHKHIHNAVKIIIRFKPCSYPPINSLSIDGAVSLPKEISNEILSEYKHRGEGNINTETICFIKNKILDTYQALGIYPPVMESLECEGGQMKINILERWVKNVVVTPVDEYNNPIQKSELNLQSITQDIRSIIKESEPVSFSKFNRALQSVIDTKMIERAGLAFVPEIPEQIDGHIFHAIEVWVKERPLKNVEFEAKWQIRSRSKGLPIVEKLLPHVALSYEHHNLGGHGTQFSANMKTQDLTDNNGLNFKVAISRPYYFGMTDPRKTTFDMVAFNKRSQSPVFISSSNFASNPIFVDRIGIKAALKETYSHRSIGSMSMVIESVSCVDSEGNLQTQGKKISNHETQPGPRTTISKSGSDSIISLRGDIVHDETTFHKGSLIGARDTFTASQGIGFAFFNSFTTSITRFIPVQIPHISKKSLASLVLHGKFGNSIGNVASYDYFILGGPFSCRGYDFGEIGSSRRFIEMAAETRYPVNLINGQIFSFYEHTNSLSDGQVPSGDPNEFYRRSGKGSSWGYGIKLGTLRFEYARDCNLAKGSWYVRIGDRF